MYYNKQGEKITLEEYGKIGTKEYSRIAEDTIGDYWVSTVWLGLDHNFDGGKPLIFETMVFKGEDSDIDMDRYSTEEEAIKGHQVMIEKYKNK